MKGGGAISAEIVEPYASALMSLAQENDLSDRLGEDARALRDVLKESQDLTQFLENPVIKLEDKKAVIRQLVGEQIHHYTLNFLMLLVDRGRILFLDDVCQQYLALLRELNQTVLAEVTSTVELSEGQKQAVCDRVKAMTDARDVEIETHIDPTLLGGATIKVGSQFIDASLRGQLRRIGMRLTQGAA